mmetsp:Transcript_209/g.133  ORF Transcript_209/g.133 Transcript_209/m.133 type:complete len:167 (+) Transcript_209:713-1213(+)
MPILRPMWQEFPHHPNSFNQESQFMFGDQLLIAPKLLVNDGEDIAGAIWTTINQVLNIPMEDKNKVQVYFPEGHTWYYFYSKKPFSTSNDVQNSFRRMDLVIPASEQGIFVKGGAILPIKLHRGKLSLLRAFKQPLRLEVYLEPISSADLLAQGLVYMDDGETLDY